MTRDYFKSAEGLAEYEKISMPYPEEIYDANYDKFLKLTKNTKEKDYKIHIQSMNRFILEAGEGGGEYIIHDMLETRLDPLGNVKSFYRGNIGKYPKPIPRYEIKVIPEEGYSKEKYVAGIDDIKVGYSIPFTPENIDRLQQYCTGTTAYSIQKQDYQSGIVVSIASIEDWRLGEPAELLRFGHRASAYEKQILADEAIGKYQDHVLSNAARVYR